MNKAIFAPAWLKAANTSLLEDGAKLRPEADGIIAWNEDGERLHKVRSGFIYASRRRAGGWEILPFGLHPAFVNKVGLSKYGGDLPLKIVFLRDVPIQVVALTYDGTIFVGAANSPVDALARIAFVSALPAGSVLHNPLMSG